MTARRAGTILAHALGKMHPLIVTEADFANLTLLEPPGQLQRLLEDAIVVASDAIAPDIVTMNSQVVLSDGTTGERRIAMVVYPAEADGACGRISVLDPMGTALLGASPGQTIECDHADGTHYLRVEQVIHQPEHSLRAHLFVRR